MIYGIKGFKNRKKFNAGESMARNKYTYFASTAKKEGYEQISAIFLETANNEKEHAKLWFKLLDGIGNTMDNLKAAAAGENEEHTDMYPTFAKEARDERGEGSSFDDIAKLFDLVAKIEAHHEERYKKLIDNINNSTVFKSEGKKLWICRNCGHIHYGESAPKVCPTCKHPQAYFEIMAENF